MSYIGNQPTTTAFVTDTFNGNGSTTTFTMSLAPATTSSILVSITGALQDPSTYSVSGTTLTFSSPPSSGTGNISVRYLGIPASGVTTTAYRTVTEFTATAGQTSFSVPSYTVGYINVFRNGVLLGSADYTASTGTTVVLASACNAGDLVQTVSFYVSSVLNAIPATAGAVNSTYIADNAVNTAEIANAAVTPAKLSQPLTLSTAQASTSGTSIDFTGIPSWVKRITVMFQGMSTNGTSIVMVQVGSGSITASGYAGSGAYMGTSTAGINISAGIPIGGTPAAVDVRSGLMILTLIGSNTWVASCSGGQHGANFSFTSGGTTPALSGTLDRVRITTLNGTDTFDAGSINIMYE